jgi:transcriptional regulator GlxA family with amidase domain
MESDIKYTKSGTVNVTKQSVSNQVILNQTVKNLLTETNVSFVPHNRMFETVFGDSYLLFTTSQKQNGQLQKEESTKVAQKKVFIERVIQVINKHMNNECFGVEMLCKEMGISERQLQRKIKAIVKKSPNQLISSMRLNLAKELINSTEYTISEIAFKTGFSNPSYFSKCFKKEFSICPSDLKR